MSKEKKIPEDAVELELRGNKGRNRGNILNI